MIIVQKIIYEAVQSYAQNSRFNLIINNKNHHIALNAEICDFYVNIVRVDLFIIVVFLFIIEKNFRINY